MDLNPVDDLSYWENLLKASIKISVKRLSNKVKWEIQKLNSWMFWLPKVMCSRYYVIFFFHIKQIKWELLNSSCNTVVQMWSDVHFRFFSFPHSSRKVNISKFIKPYNHYIRINCNQCNFVDPRWLQKGKHLKIHKALQPPHSCWLQSV